MTAVAAAARVLEGRLGLDPACIGDATLAAAVDRRVRRLGLESPARYAGLLDGDEAEAVALAEEILVRESWFFRDGKPFELLARILGVRRGTRPLRILSAPCARGEEPYSVVVALLASGCAPADVAVDAIDLSQQALDDARRGEYGPRALRSPADAPERRWLAGFVEAGTGGRFMIAPSVRERVCFRQASLLELERTVDPGYDAVLCRNALIYLSATARAAVVEACWRVLAPGGLLIVGHAEAGSLLDRWFERLPEAGAFAFVRRDAPYAEAPVTSCAKRPAPSRTMPDAMRDAVPRRAASTVVTMRAHPAVAAPGALLADARALADRGRYVQAAALIAAHLAVAPADVEAHHLLGVVQAARGDDPAARRALERALYLDPTHGPSLTQLALLLDTAGDAAGAARLRRRAERPPSA